MTEDRIDTDSATKAREDSSSIQDGCFGLSGKSCVKSGKGYHPLTPTKDDSCSDTCYVRATNDSYMQEGQLTAGFEAISIKEHPEAEEQSSSIAAMPKKTKVRFPHTHTQHQFQIG